MEAAPHPWPALGVLLMRDGLVSKDELEEILSQQLDTRQQRLSGRRLGEILIQRGRVTPTQVARLVAEQYELPFVDFDVADMDVLVARVLSEDDARRFSAVPISRRPDGSYVLAVADPSTVLFSDELRKLLGSVPRFVVVGPDAIEKAIDTVHGNPTPAHETRVDGEHEAVLLSFPPATGLSFDVIQPPTSHDPLVQTWPPLGALLVREGFLTDDDLDAALAQQRLSPSHRLGEILVEKGIVSRSVVARLVAEQYELPYVELDRLDVDPFVARRLPEEIAHRHSAVPITLLDDGSLEVAISDPTSAVYSDELQQALDTPLTFVVSSPDSIGALLERVHALEHVAEEPELAPEHAEPLSDPGPVVFAGDAEHPSETLESMPSMSFVLEEFVPPTEAAPDPDAPVSPGADVQTDEPVFEPERPHLVFDSTGSSVLDDPGVNDDPAWTSRLELVDELVGDEEPEVVEHDMFSFTWTEAAETTPEPPVHEVVEEVVEVVEVVEADVVELAWPSTADVDEPVEESASEPQIAEAADHGVFSFTWTETAETTPEPPVDEVVDEPIAEIAEADVVEIAPPPVADVVEAPVVEEDPEPQVAETTEPDIFSLSWTATAETAPEPPVDEVVDEPIAKTADHGVFSFTWTEAAETTPEPPVHEVSEEPVAEVVEVDVVELAWPSTADVADEPVKKVAEVPAVDGAPDPEVEQVADADLPAAPIVYFPVQTDHVVPEPEPPYAEPFETAAAPDTLPTVTSVLRGDLDTAVETALAEGASTLHFSPRGPELAVRARVDGLVRDLGTASRGERDALVERLETEGVVRAHVVATSRGEKTTLFVRERAETRLTLDELGLDPDVAATLRGALERSSGAVLVCGPPGSGTTTTLYALVETFAAPDRIVTTVEQPVERFLDGADQIEVDPGRGASFASVLRELRFTDPDAVLVGALADSETAGLALQASVEGTLVLAGLRAPTAAAGVALLADMGVEPSVLGPSLGCVVAQRLVRTVCPHCRETHYATADELEALGQPDGGSPRLLVRGRGCDSCDGSGFLGHVGLFEVMPVTEEIRRLVSEGASAKKIQKAAVATGMRTLREEGVRLCLDGQTTASEVVRVLEGA